jgi:alpha-tubulin suppressor-like RCC1 family protein
MGDALAAVDLGPGKKAVAVAVGQSLASQVTMTCALLDDATVKCWGYNGYGTLGVGDRVDRGATLASMGAALAPIDLGAGVRVASVSVTSGGYSVQGLSACAVTDTGRVKCWGLNRKGILGLGDTTTRGDTPATMGTALPYVELF